MVGIYKITNKVNEKVYIGESTNIENRWVSHIRKLVKQTHHSDTLQNDFNTYGIENFKFEVLQIIDDNLQEIIIMSLLYVLENKYIRKYNAINKGYNVQNTLGLVLNTKLKFKNNLEITILKQIIRIFNENNKKYDLQLINNIKVQLKEELKLVANN